MSAVLWLKPWELVCALVLAVVLGGQLVCAAWMFAEGHATAWLFLLQAGGALLGVGTFVAAVWRRRIETGTPHVGRPASSDVS